MQAEDAERNPSDCTSREIAVKVNNELQQTPPPPRYYCCYYSCFFQSFSKRALNYQGSRLISHSPALIHKPSPYGGLICNWFGAGLTLWAKRRQERGRRRGGEPGAGGGGRGAPGGRAPAASLRPACGKGSRAGVMKQDFCLPSSSLFFLSFSPPPPPPSPFIPSAMWYANAACDSLIKPICYNKAKRPLGLEAYGQS